MFAIIKNLRRFYNRLRTRDDLFRLSVHELEDIGLARGTIDEVSYRMGSGS